ncbi:hypothetical protein [Candidatus Leptofilum sp.]|uniref:hypothetical protein n=1 Tax=Candidatus Leptofilum sp. TaxID=3241576 RepID=UPI003B5C8277
MKRLWTLLLLLCSTAVFLIACSDNQAAEAVVPTESPETATITVPPTAPPEEVSIDTSDLTLIGQTGRPQLLNVYASW